MDGAKGGRPRGQWEPSRPDPTPGARDSPTGISCSSLHRAASGPTALFRNTKAAGAAIGGVKNMLLEWCRAMTRNYEVGTVWGYRRDRDTLPQGNSVVENLRVQIPKGGRGKDQALQLGVAKVFCSPPAYLSTWISKTSPPAGAAAWPSVPSSTSFFQKPLTMQSWTQQSAGTTSP